MTKEEFTQKYPTLVFVKTKSRVEAGEGLRDDNFIFADNTPALVKDVSVIMPLNVADFPCVLRSMTAMEAGMWAVGKCLRQGWEVSGETIESCLANLEMDF